MSSRTLERMWLTIYASRVSILTTSPSCWRLNFRLKSCSGGVIFYQLKQLQCPTKLTKD